MTAGAPDRYNIIAVIVHWATVALLVALFALGWRMVAMPLSPSKFEFYALHKSLGLVVLALTTLRLVWRLVGSAPAPFDGPRWQTRAAGIAHTLLYTLLLLLPLSGWLFNSAVGFPLSFFGLADIPPLVAPRPALKEAVRSAHFWVGWVLLGLLGMHIGAALHHHFILRDRILSRMLPRFPKSLRRPA